MNKDSNNLCFDDKKSEDVINLVQFHNGKEAIKEIAKLLNIKKELVLIVTKKNGSRNDSPKPVVSLDYAYDPEFISFLKSSEGFSPYFSSSLKNWSIIYDETTYPHFIEKIRDRFNIVVYTDIDKTSNVFEFTPSYTLRKPIPVFRKLKFNRRLSVSDIKSDISKFREQDDISESRFYILYKEKFQPVSFDEFITDSPFIMLRYAPSNKQPRYLVYSTIAKSIESISYGNKSKETSMALARFKESFELEEINVVIDKGSDYKEAWN